VALHRALLRLRRDRPSLRASDACTCSAEAPDDSTIAFERDAPGDEGLLIVGRLRGHGAVTLPVLRGYRHRPILDTEDLMFASDGRPPRVDAATGTIEFHRPGAVIFQRTSTANEPAGPAQSPEE
jgi:hypothetical protein